MDDPLYDGGVSTFIMSLISCGSKDCAHNGFLAACTFFSYNSRSQSVHKNAEREFSYEFRGCSDG
jgi:hypothetical protein